MVALALGAFGAGKLLSRRPELARRIESILGQRASGNPALAAVLIAGIVGGAAAMTRAPELVSFAAQDGVAGASQIALKESPDAGRAAVRRIVPAARMENVSLRIVQPVSKPALAEVGRAATEDAARDGVMVPGSLRVGSARFVATRATLDAPRPVAVAAVQKEMVDQEQEWVLIASWTASPIESQEVSAETLPAPTQTVVNGGDTRAIVATNTVLKDKGGKPGATNFARPVSQIVVRTPDGRFYVIPYAAVPTQAGWLIVQL
jgi:hypothetical protein